MDAIEQLAKDILASGREATESIVSQWREVQARHDLIVSKLEERIAAITNALRVRPDMIPLVEQFIVHVVKAQDEATKTEDQPQGEPDGD